MTKIDMTFERRVRYWVWREESHPAEEERSTTPPSLQSEERLDFEPKAPRPGLQA